MVLPIIQQPVPSLAAFGVVLLGLPVYAFFVMETPWKLRPKIFDRISGEGRERLALLFYTNVCRDDKSVRKV